MRKNIGPIIALSAFFLAFGYSLYAHKTDSATHDHGVNEPAHEAHMHE